MKGSVLDSYAILAFLFHEAGSGKVAELFEKAAESNRALLMAAPNWAEVRYIVERKLGKAQWDRTREKLLALPIEIAPVDQTLAELAGEIKATQTMPLADCFATALAKLRRAELVTGDKDFRQAEDAIKISWL